MPIVEPLVPWSDENEDDTSQARQLTRLFAAVPPPSSLSDVARQRVAGRLRGRAARGVGRILLRTMAVGLVLGVTGAAAAQWATKRWFAPKHVVVARSAHGARVQAAPTLQAAPPAPPPVAVVEPSPAQITGPARVAMFPPASASSTPLGLEAASLEQALSALRGGGRENAGRALRALDRHLREFPRGALELEARVARVDALLVLGRRQEARAELSSLPVEKVGRRQELLLIRAELRAEDDCRSALDDFTALLEQSPPAAWAERALFGRSVCLSKLGDTAAAERDFARYLERFPAGRFAAQIRAQRR